MERVGSVVWAADNFTMFYTVEDEEQKRQYQFYRHMRGTPYAADVLVYQDDDERFNVGAGRTRDGKYIVMESSSHTTSCMLGHPGAPGDTIKHVIYIQFDNVHYNRDNPSVPSDLQQMPNLLKFITGQGTLITHEHTPLIAHTADDIVTSESGLYGSDQGVPCVLGDRTG